MKKYYPVFLDLENERAVVIGEGHLADEKAAALRTSGADVDVLSSSAYEPARLDGARIVIDTSGDDELGARVFRDAEERGILVNVLDRPHRCRFIAPAVVDRHPLQIAISTAGESPYLAAALRRRLESLFGAEWSTFVALVGRIRRDLRRRGTALEVQTETYTRLLRSPIRQLLRDGMREEAEAEAEAIAAGTGRRRAGHVTLVGAGPGDPRLLTLAGADALAEADLVLYDALVSPAVLRFVSPTAELIEVGKRGGRKSARQEDINHRLVEAAAAGRQVARLKGGDPFIFGRGGEELQALLDAGLAVTVIPGVSAAVSAPAAAGIPLTMRGVASSVAFVTATADGIGPIPGLRELAAAVDTLVILMPLASLESLAAELSEVLGASRPAAIVSRATLPDQKIVQGRIGELSSLARANAIEAPATLVIGDVVTAVVDGRGTTEELTRYFVHA
jgi:uroporphyrin-III C-methyltransferase/precorrin-2 dehydrogenase/sirohydrochlorin ferrochelatase